MHHQITLKPPKNMYRRSRSEHNIKIIEKVHDAKHYQDTIIDPELTTSHTLYESDTLIIRGINLYKTDSFINGEVVRPDTEDQHPSFIWGAFIYFVGRDAELATRHNGKLTFNLADQESCIFVKKLQYLRIRVHSQTDYPNSNIRFLIVQRKITSPSQSETISGIDDLPITFLKSVYQDFNTERNGISLDARYHCKLIAGDTISSGTSYYYLCAQGIHFNFSHPYEYVFLNLGLQDCMLEAGSFNRRIRWSDLVIVQPHMIFTIKSEDMQHLRYSLLFMNYDKTKTPPLTSNKRRTNSEDFTITSLVMNDNGFIAADAENQRMIRRLPYPTPVSDEDVPDYFKMKSAQEIGYLEPVDD
jgi:hypothetical protein